jgi:hypothetical protein
MTTEPKKRAPTEWSLHLEQWRMNHPEMKRADAIEEAKKSFAPTKPQRKRKVPKEDKEVPKDDGTPLIIEPSGVIFEPVMMDTAQDDPVNEPPNKKAKPKLTLEEQLAKKAAKAASKSLKEEQLSKITSKPPKIKLPKEELTRRNPWLAHVLAYKAEFPDLTFKKVLEGAAETWKKLKLDILQEEPSSQRDLESNLVSVA